MTTASWSTRIRHDDTPTYQEWRDEMITKLGIMVTAGVLAADETNITPGAGARPGTSTEGGYAVYHLADSLHGTAPVYIRFGFGTGLSATAPAFKATVGTSTNGSGVLGGTALSALTFLAAQNATQVTDTARQSYLCAVAGFLGLSWKVGATVEGSFFICRTCDNTGAPTVTGALARWGSSNAGGITLVQAYRYAATAAAYTSKNAVDQGALGINPQAPTATTVGSDVQVMLGWTITPRVEPLFAVCGVNQSELAVGGTFTATVVGTTARTFLTMGQGGGPFGSLASNATGGLCVAMIWE